MSSLFRSLVRNLAPRSLCFRERVKTQPDYRWLKLYTKQSDSLVWFSFFFSVIGPLADVNLPYRTALKCNYGTCSCISRVFLRELGFTVFTILTGDLFAKFDEMCWTTLICKLLRVEWVSEDLQYNRTLWSFFNIYSKIQLYSVNTKPWTCFFKSSKCS